MSREQGSHEQLSHKRAEEQAGEAVDGRSKGQIGLRRITVEHRYGNRVTRASLILDESLAATIGRNSFGLRSIRSYDARRPRWRSSAGARLAHRLWSEFGEDRA
jgi:hypothetical protein